MTKYFRVRIKSAGIYIVAMPQGISGFRKPDAVALVTGKRKRRDLLDDAGPSGNLNLATFRLEDGHLPDYQPRATYDEACRWLALRENEWAAAVLLK